MTDTPIKDEWNRFFEAVVPAGTCNAHLKVIRRAFYVGARTMFRAMYDTANVGDVTGEQVGEQYIKFLKEINDFAEEVKAGRA